MARKVNPIPEGYGTVTAALVVPDSAKAIDFYGRAFGATELFRMQCPESGRVVHAEIRIGSSIVMLSDEQPEEKTRSPLALGGSPVSLHLYVEDVDAVFAKALRAGAKQQAPVADMFWGDRYGRLVDPFGHGWGIATHKEDLSPDEIGRRAAELFGAPAKACE